MLTGLAPAVESLLQAAAALAGGLTAATWVLWGVGSAPLIMLAVGLHLLNAMSRRRGGGSGPQQPTGGRVTGAASSPLRDTTATRKPRLEGVNAIQTALGRTDTCRYSPRL